MGPARPRDAADSDIGRRPTPTAGAPIPAAATQAVFRMPTRVRRRTHTRAAASGLDVVARLMADAREQLLAEHDVVR